ncbi:hypothetical protein WJX75_000689 [Coccomyxa subellipsoidea]|uniref:Uncharacterized protein n=1 Tax=Coccomyxa subellipsoidea TaxID=248742 RepID=A0ABR2YV92_9CHLO
MAWSNPSGKDNPEWLAEELPAPVRRDRLLPPAQQEKSASLWSIIKECVGKDLTRICLPVFFKEPLSALQRVAEELEYSELLDTAATFPPGSEERMLYVVAFAVSGYSSTAGRTSKPFNPLLGETYEIVHPEKGLRAIVEKVVHHPMLTPVGLLTLTFKDGDEYTWHKVVSSINNLIIAKVHMDHGGTMRIHSSASGLVCKLKYREQGVLRMREKLEKPLVFDKWDEAMYAEMPGNTQRLLWQKSEPPPDPTRYNLTNTVTPGLEKKLAPTDCRLRPDQHHLELGQYDQANAEKLRLETTQRAARKAAEQGAPIKLRWFARVEGAEPGRQQAYVYHGGNFEAVAIVKQKLSTTISELVAEELKVVSFKCVQPTQPKDASELWNSDNVQTLEFFTSLVKGGSDNCLADKCWSAPCGAMIRRRAAAIVRRSIRRSREATRKARVLHNDAEDSGSDTPAQASKRSRSGNAAARKHTTVLNESDDDSHREAPKKNSGKTLKEGGLEWFTAAAPRRDDEEGPSQKKKATTKASAAKRQSLGTIKDHGEATGGPKRRKVLRATYNDKESSE